MHPGIILNACDYQPKDPNCSLSEIMRFMWQKLGGIKRIKIKSQCEKLLQTYAVLKYRRTTK